jgi:hypothetical protein
MIIKVIDVVENRGPLDIDLEKSLMHAFDVEQKISGPPQRATISLPSYNLIPTKRKQSSIS